MSSTSPPSNIGLGAKEIFDCVVDLLNFAVVVILLIWTLRDRKRQSQREANAFWVQNMVLEPKLPLIDDFFDTCPKFMVPLAAKGDESVDHWQERARERITDFKPKLASLRNDVVVPLTWIHTEFDALDSILNRIQELVVASTTLASDVSAPVSANEVDQEYRQLQREFYQTLIVGQAKATHLNIAVHRQQKTRWQFFTRFKGSLADRR